VLPAQMDGRGPDAITLIYWDWDDTLLCSSYLSGQGFQLDSDLAGCPEMVRQLKELEGCVVSALGVALELGPVTVVTNAETGWVEKSAEKFLPGVLPFLSRTKVVSARSTFESRFPDAPYDWKFHAFQESLAGFAHCRAKNVLSFGDSHVEREAVKAATKAIPTTRCKSIKFAERPSIEQLQRQIELVTSVFRYITTHEGDLDLCMTLSQEPVESTESAAFPQEQAQAHERQGGMLLEANGAGVSGGGSLSDPDQQPARSMSSHSHQNDHFEPLEESRPQPVVA